MSGCQREGVLVHRFNKEDTMDVDRRDEQVNPDGKAQTKTIFTARYSADISADCDFVL